MAKTDTAAKAAKRQRKPAASEMPPTASTTKINHIITLLRRAEGTGIDELIAATGWQPHSVRGAISGTLKKRLRLVVTSQKSEAGRVYRIADNEAG